MRTFWTLCVCALSAASGFGQTAPTTSLAALEAAAKQKSADWQMLAQGLPAKIGRSLPCDPKVTAAIDEVRKASEARLAALASYLQAAGQSPSADPAEVKRLTASAQSLAADLAGEKAETSDEQTAIDGQLTNLAEGLKTRSSLAEAQTALQQVQTDARQRGDAIQNAALQQTLLTTSLGALSSAVDARAAAWKNLQVAYEAERARWNAYYGARLARADTECSVTKGVGSSSSSRGKRSKQK